MHSYIIKYIDLNTRIKYIELAQFESIEVARFYAKEKYQNIPFTIRRQYKHKKIDILERKR